MGKQITVLIACEFSGMVRKAFAKKGHDAWSCDLVPTDVPGNHIEGNVLDIIQESNSWDLMIAHPPCTHLAVSGARYFKEKQKDGRQQKAIEFFMALANAPIDKICIENPVCIMSSKWRKPDQYIQPYEYGHAESKKTGLWLKNLPLLQPTKKMEPEYYQLPDGSIYRDKKGAKYSKTHFNPEKYKPRWLNQTPSGQNKLGPSEERSRIRSITYPGIAKAMANQWG